MRAGLVGTMVAGVLALPTTAVATLCSSMLSPDGAAVVLEGVAQSGPSTPDGLLTSPATFEVLQYVKGTGPASVEVHTGITVQDGLVQMVAGSIAPRAGEEWRILATADTDLSEPVPSVCTMSVRLGDAADTGARHAVPASGHTPAKTSVLGWAWALIAVPLGLAGMAWRRALPDHE